MGLILTKQKEADCPEVRHRRVGDETYDICDLTGRNCLLEHGLYECAFFLDFLSKESYNKTVLNNKEDSFNGSKED